MIKTVFSMATAIALGIAALGSFKAHASIEAPKAPETVVIGLDMSASNPLVEDTDHAKKVAARIADKVRTLSVRSRVLIRPFGAYNSSVNDRLRIDSVISARNRPEALAMKVEQLITNIPDYVQQGTLEAEGYTNIIAFLENMMEVTDCSSAKTTFILLSDGVEDSTYTNLQQAKGNLPRDTLRADGVQCHELQILGLGKGLNNPQETKRLRGEWRAWSSTEAGSPFTRFVGLNDW